MLQIRLLGQFDIRLNGKRILIPSRAGQSLVAYLALTAGTPHRREVLAGILWPDFSDDNARKNLRHELWRIRKALAGSNQVTDYLLADEFTIAFNRNADYWLDATQLERPDLDIQTLSSNLSLYQGDLLPGFFEDWIMLERERLQAIFETKMAQLLNQLMTAERWIAVQEQGERWLALGNSPEPAYRALMLAHGARSDISKVSYVYQRCITELDEKLGLEPSAETRALYDGLLQGTHIPRSAAIQQAGTVTFLFTDIEESTNLLEKLGHQYADVLADHHKIMRAAIQKWNGHEVDTQGDAFFVTFTRALDAIQCAAEAQKNLSAHPWLHGKSLRVRMGLHTGEPLIGSTGYVGMDVHRAARIGDSAHGGQVLLSHITRELVITDLPKNLSIRDLGEFRLKDLKFPAPIYQLVIEGLSFEFPPLRTKFTGTEVPTPGEPPFKGLQYFDEIDSELFFGREVVTAKLIGRLRESHFLSVVIGASGSGKSSVVRAGVIPSLKMSKALIDGSNPPEDSSNWRMHILTPTVHPLEALATELTRDSESVTATATLMDDLMQDPRSLGLFLARQQPQRHTLLVLDQFEELFTLCRDEFEREEFIDNLLTALSKESRLTIIITLRADFYAHLAQYPELRDAVAHQQEYIGPMTIEELRRAIEEPAKRAHWAFEPGLVDLILRDVGDEPGALPLLSHALLETWKRRVGHTLTLKGYADSGGVRGAISHTAESVYQNLSVAEQTIARNIFLRLTELGEGTEDTRRRASFDELMSNKENAQETSRVLNQLAEARLITLSENTAEVAHEALIREWHTLREWLNQDRDGLRLHRNITEGAQEWELLEHDPGMLYRGARLSQAREWAALHPNVLNTDESTFLEASDNLEKQEQAEREAQQQRELEAARKLAQTERQRAEEGARSADQLRKRALYLAGAFVIALLMALTALFFGGQARQAAATAQANLTRSTAQRLAAEAQTMLQAGGDAELIALLSIRSMNTQYTAQGDSDLMEAAALDYPRMVLAGDQGAISSVAYSPDGQHALIGGWDGMGILWDSQSGQIVRRFLGHTGGVFDVAFSPDGSQILTGGEDGTVRLWDATTGDELRKFAGGEGPVFGVAFSPDGRYMVAGGQEGIARLWEIQSAKTALREFIGHTDRLFSVGFSPDGRQILTAGNDQTVRLWDAATGREERRFSGSNGYSANAVFSPDGKSILVAGGFGAIARLLDADTGQELRKFVGHQSGVGRVAFSPDGRYVLTGSDDKTARLWDAETGEELRQFTAHGSGVRSLAFSPDGNQVLTGSYDGAARVWDIHPQTELPQFLGHTDGVTAVVFSSDGKYVLTGSTDKTARLWDAHSGRKLRAFIGHTDGLNYGVAFSPDDEFVVTGSWDGTVRLWDTQTGSELRRFDGHTAGVNRVAFSPDGKTILSASQDTTARLWDVQDGAELCQFVGHTGPVSWVAFSPDGKSALTGSDDHTARLWDIDTCKELRIFEPHHDSVYGAAFSPDGKYVATGSLDGIARLWDAQTGEGVRDFVGHLGLIWSIAFSPDGKLLATVGDDQTARLWDVQSGREVRRFAYSAGLSDVAFSPDGEYLLTGSYDGTAKVWEIDYDKTIQFLCAQLSRDLADDEREQYDIGDGEPTCPIP
jgi:FOG: WD40 repeat